MFTKMLSDLMKVFWIKWELHVMVGLSLILQFVLLVFGNRQKFQGRRSLYIAILVWFTYLTADWIATVALSTLLKAKENDINSQLVVFWTPFLLLHLGGPHTISAITLSDNELWLRSFLGLIIQVGVAVYVYMRFRTSSNTHSILTYMAIPLFIAGIIKYGERIWILRAASRKQYSKSIFSTPKPSFLTHMMGACPPRRTADLRAETLDEYLESKRVIQEGKNIYKAFCLYKMFKPLFSDLKLRIHKDLTQTVFLPSMLLEFKDAFKVVKMELGFLYDVLYTKTTILLSIAGVILRSICLLSTLSALIAFSIINKSSYPKPDTTLTYVLLTGAFFFDVSAAFSHVLSNWTMLDLTVRDNKVYKFVGGWGVSWLIRHGEDKKEIASMAQHSLIDYCLKVKSSWWTKIVRFIDTDEILSKFWWTTWKPVSLEFKNFIHSSLKKKKEEYINDCKFRYQGLLDLLASKGKSVLKRENVLKEFSWSMEDVEFSHSLLLWHIATFLLFHDDHRRYSGSVVGSYCQISKQLSDYMMYLLLVRPFMLPRGIGEVRIRDTQKHVLRFFNMQSSLTESEAANALLHIEFHYEVVTPDLSKTDVNQVQSKSVLRNGLMLARQLQALVDELRWDYEEKWKMIADVWMEMLVFAASKCEWREHASQLKNGDELITHVALLMAHFGLTEHIRVVEVSTPLDGEILIDSSQWNWELSHLAYYLA